MKRLLVLGTTGVRDRWVEDLLLRLNPQPRFAHAESATSDCDGLLVVDDGSSDGFAAMRSALALRDSHPGLPIAVVTPLDSRWSKNECLVRSQRRPGIAQSQKFRIGEERVRALMQSGEPQFDVSISDDAICFEYHE